MIQDQLDTSFAHGTLTVMQSLEVGTFRSYMGVHNTRVPQLLEGLGLEQASPLVPGSYQEANPKEPQLPGERQLRYTARPRRGLKQTWIPLFKLY